jgi:hypothetical protein
MSLLHVVCGIVRREFPAVLEFIEDLKDVPEAARGKSTPSNAYFLFMFLISDGKHFRYSSTVHRYETGPKAVRY